MKKTILTVAALTAVSISSVSLAAEFSSPLVSLQNATITVVNNAPNQSLTAELSDASATNNAYTNAVIHYGNPKNKPEVENLDPAKRHPIQPLASHEATQPIPYTSIDSLVIKQLDSNGNLKDAATYTTFQTPVNMFVSPTGTSINFKNTIHPNHASFSPLTKSTVNGENLTLQQLLSEANKGQPCAANAYTLTVTNWSTQGPTITPTCTYPDANKATAQIQNINTSQGEIINCDASSVTGTDTSDIDVVNPNQITISPRGSYIYPVDATGHNWGHLNFQENGKSVDNTSNMPGLTFSFIKNGQLLPEQVHDMNSAINTAKQIC